MRSTKKIACIFNMNNNMFTLTRFLRDRGFDAELILFNEDDHFLPENDTFSSDSKNYSFQYDWLDTDNYVPKVTKEEIKNVLSRYDLIIGCGFVPAFCDYAGIKLDIFVPYGSDFYTLPFKSHKFFGQYTLKDNYPMYQKSGIEKSKHVLFDYTSEQEKVFEKFDMKGKRHYLYVPVFYTPEFNKNNVENLFDQSKLYPLIKKLRSDNDLLFIQHCRQSWKNPQDEFSNKGNDLLLRAFAMFVSKRSELKVKLLLLEYGNDVKASKELINELGIDEHIVWIPRSPRKEIMIAISMSDLGIGELTLSFLIYGAVGEFMSMNLPFILNCVEKEYLGKYPELYPMNHANSVETVFDHLIAFSNNKENYISRSEKTFEWFNKFIITDPLDKICSILDEEFAPWHKKIFK